VCDGCCDGSCSEVGILDSPCDGSCNGAAVKMVLAMAPGSVLLTDRVLGYARTPVMASGTFLRRFRSSNL